MKKDQKGFSTIVVAMFVAATTILAGAGVWVWQMQIAKTKPVLAPAIQKIETLADESAENVNEAGAETAETASDQIQPINNAGWKTYRNEEWGFEFEYPDEYYRLEEIDNGIQFATDDLMDCQNLISEKEKMFCSQVEGGASPLVYFSSAKERLQGMSFSDYLNGQAVAGSDIKKIEGNNIWGVEIEENGMAGKYKSIYFLRGDRLINFSVAGGSNNKGGFFLDQIVATFKFIEPDVRYDMFGRGDFSTIVEGYYQKREYVIGGIADSDGKEVIDSRPYFAITKFMDPEFEKSIKDAVERGNAVNRYEDGRYNFNLGFFENGKIGCINYLDPSAICIDSIVESRIKNSTLQNPVKIKLFFGFHEHTVNNLAYKIEIVD